MPWQPERIMANGQNFPDQAWRFRLLPVYIPGWGWRDRMYRRYIWQEQQFGKGIINLGLWSLVGVRPARLRKQRIFLAHYCAHGQTNFTGRERV